MALLLSFVLTNFIISCCTANLAPNDVNTVDPLKSDMKFHRNSQNLSRDFPIRSLRPKVSDNINPQRRNFKQDTSGNCGSSATWEYDTTTCKLTISGTGSMNSFEANTMPWYAFKEEMKTVTIKNGVTSIGASSFLDFRSLNF